MDMTSLDMVKYAANSSLYKSTTNYYVVIKLVRLRRFTINQNYICLYPPRPRIQCQFNDLELYVDYNYEMCIKRNMHNLLGSKVLPNICDAASELLLNSYVKKYIYSRIA